MERNIVTQAIALHSRRDGVNNVNISLLSIDLGVITIRAFGAKTSKKAPKAFRFQEGQFFIYFNPTKKQYILKDVNLIATHDGLLNDYSNISIASIMSEIILKTYSDDSAYVYNLFTKSLDFLEDDSINKDIILIQFILRFIKNHGFFENFTNCPNCEKKYSDEEILYFSNTLSVPSCKNCSNSSNMLLPPKARKYLSITLNMSIEDAINIKLYETTATRIKSYMIRWITNIIGYPLKSVTVLN
ncbi:MAG: DNA repair protein RecO [Pleomorphochaeta sp.]